MTTVRIVDDDEGIAEMLSALLTIEGIVNTRTSTRFEELLANDPWIGVDVVLCDLALGCDITGQDVLAYLRDYHRHIRRIVLSAFGDLTHVAEELGDLADAVLAKPSEFGDIIREVRGG